MRVPLFGSLIAAAGMIPIDRDAGTAAIRILLRESDRAVREGMQIVIFPEGTRSEPGKPEPMQPGILALASRTGLPIVPVATDSGLCWGRRAFRKRPGTIHIVIGEPIPPDGRSAGFGAGFGAGDGCAGSLPGNRYGTVGIILWITLWSDIWVAWDHLKRLL